MVMIAQLLRPRLGSVTSRGSVTPAVPHLHAPRTLADLRPGQQARITGFSDMGPIVQRLLHLGLLRGEVITMKRQALTGDPIEIRLLDYCLSLRRKEAALVQVETVA